MSLAVKFIIALLLNYFKKCWCQTTDNNQIVNFPLRPRGFFATLVNTNRDLDSVVI